ncbi:MAG: lysophospholipid acyltransferase family protein [Bacteroidota bacterium]|nr:lysophospholipid acyltransferase family protein [Bacteroidota bacterium]
MARFLFHIIYNFLWLISWLPLRAFYFGSDVLYFFGFYLIRYRREISSKNLENSFPAKSPSELKTISKKFYRYFSDLIVEAVYLIGMKPKESLKRFRYKNLSVLEDIYREEKSVILLFPHYGNWEWLANLELVSPFHFLAIYKPLSSVFFDNLFKKLRERYGGETVPMNKSLRRILTGMENKERTITFFLYDQRPRKKELHHWLSFMNQETPVLLGAEKIARKTGQTVIFLKTTRLKRGYYENEFIKICDDPADLPKFEITNIYYRLVENLLNEAPEYWLWTHNRWKFSRK